MTLKNYKLSSNNASAFTAMKRLRQRRGVPNYLWILRGPTNSLPKTSMTPMRFKQGLSTRFRHRAGYSVNTKYKCKRMKFSFMITRFTISLLKTKPIKS
jgi:hypothetical protein